MKNGREFFYGILTLIASFIWHAQVIFSAYPIGGGEFHAIFAYSRGGQIDVAHHVFLLYVVSALVFAGFLITMLRVRLHWALIGTFAATPPLLDWWGVCTFPSASASFYGSVYPLLFTIPPIVMICSYGFSRSASKSELEGHPSCQFFY